MDDYYQIDDLHLDNTAQFFTKFPANIVEKKFLDTLNIFGRVPIISEKKYKIKFDYKDIPMTFVIERVTLQDADDEEQTICGRLINRGQDNFYEFKKIAEDMLSCQYLEELKLKGK